MAATHKHLAMRAKRLKAEETTLTEVEVEEVPKGRKIQAVYNRMRNPHTGAMFKTNLPTDVLDLTTLDNAWTRAQLIAGTLKEV